MDEALGFDLDFGKTMLRETGELMPMLNVVDAAGMNYAIGFADFGETQGQRAQTMRMIGATIGFGVDAQQLRFLIDSWYRVMPKVEGESKEQAEQRAQDGPSPSQSPDRKECMLAGLLRKDGSSETWMQLYSRQPDGTIDFEEVQDTSAGVDYTFKEFWVGVQWAEQQVERKGMDVEQARQAARQSATRLGEVQHLPGKGAASG